MMTAETFVYAGRQFVFVEDFIKNFNQFKRHLKKKDSRTKKDMDFHGLSQSLGSDITIRKNDGHLKAVIQSRYLVEYLDRVTLKAEEKGPNKSYWMNRAALVARTLVKMGIMPKKNCNFRGSEKEENELFSDVRGYGKVVFSDERRENAQKREAELHVSKKTLKQVKKAEEAHKTPIVLIQEAQVRIARRNALNEKDMAIIKENVEKLAHGAEVLRDALKVIA